MKKHCVARILHGISERLLYENNHNYNSYKFSYKFDFIPVLSFRRNQKQEPKFQQIGDLVTRNISAFLFKASHDLLQRYAEFKRLFPVRIIVPCLY